MRKIAFFAIALCIFSFSVSGAEASVGVKNNAAYGAGLTAYIEGCKAYSEGDWTTAILMLKKAVAYPENLNPDSYYMLISSEINAEENKSALDDCDFYLEKYPSTIYFPRVQFYKGKLLFTLGEYEKSIIVLSDFCHQNEADDLYPTALYYIAEALYAGYRYDEAKGIYERIVTEYPDCQKFAASEFRIEAISQRQREEKLLYLLKQTGEEYLSAKEEYEKQLRMYNPETIISTKMKLSEAQQKNEDLQRKVQDLENQLDMYRNSKSYSASSYNSVSYKDGVDVPNAEPFNETRGQVRLLRQKALDAQKALSNQNSSE